jgi:cell division protein FtsI (penicillin-binding protein 3)
VTQAKPTPSRAATRQAQPRQYASGRTRTRAGRRPPTRTRSVARPSNRSRSFKLGAATRRLRVGFLIIAFVMSVFAGRLLQLQGVEAASFAHAAVKERLQEVTLRATRGDLSDVNGVPLATTVDTVAVTADPKMTRPGAVRIAETLAPILKVPAEELLPRLRKPDTRFVYLARKVPADRWNRARKALDAHDLIGVFHQPDPLRSYPSGSVAANLIGFVGGEGRGLAGLEYALDDKLRGKDGLMVYEGGSGGQQIPLAPSVQKDPVPGANISLTIDRDVQWVAQKAIADQVKATRARSGDAIVLDVKTGQIVAMATAPTYDPNHPTRSSAEDRVNRPLQEVYEPGSVAKVLTTAALIDGGYVTPDTKISVPGSLLRNGHQIHDYWGHGTIPLTMTGALAKSSNIGTILAAERMPKAEQASYLRKFGLGRPTGTGLSGEGKGSLARPESWSDLQRATVAFGQGLSVNAVQMASAIGTVANGGVRVEPSLVRGLVDNDGELRQPAPTPKQTRVISKATASTVAAMMEQVVDGEEALATKAQIPGYRVAGKTGTSQRVDSECGCYRGYTASFAGFAPADQPRFVVYVVVQDPKRGGNSGSSLAAPVFRDIMAFTLQKYGVPPTGTSTPDMPLTW